MATSPRKPESVLSENAGPRLAMSDPLGNPDGSCHGGVDALQALLAFSSLHEKIRARRSSADSVQQDGADNVVLYEALQLVAERALALTGADGVAIALLQEREIICRAKSGTIAPEVGARLDPESGLSGACFLTGETVCCNDAENDPRVNVAASRNLHARSIIAVPLRGRRSVIGLLEAFSADAYAFNDADIRSLNLLAELILGAMKPEEEEKLEALSPAPLKSSPSAPGPAIDESVLTNLLAAPMLSSAAEDKFGDLDSPQNEPATAAEIPPALLRDYEKISNAPSSLLVASVLALVVLAFGGFLLWRFRSAPASAASTRPISPAPVRPESQSRSLIPATADLPQPAAIPPEDAQRNVLPLLTGVRHWESGDSTTVAIDLQDQVQYEVHRLNSPERIYLDLHDTVLAPGLNGTTIDVGNDLLLRVRVAQPVAGVARVVLDTANVSNFSVGLEPNPYRLIIEIRRGAIEQHSGGIDVLRPSSTARPEKESSALEPSNKHDAGIRAHVPRLKIVIDAGHGGWDLGTVGRQGVVEKDLVLEIAQHLGKLLENKLGSEVIYTRAEDVYVPLEERAEIANDSQADLFISVHANNSDYPSARGVETYYTKVSAPANSLEIEKRENATALSIVHTPTLSDAALKERTAQSRHLAASVERALYGNLSLHNPGVRDRGVKEAGFVVLTGTSMPAILAEVSFVSSPADEKNLQSSAYRERIAEALYKGIAEYAAASSRVRLASAQSSLSDQ